MGNLDFATWLDAGSYGGLTFSALVAVAIAGYALLLRRGTGRQVARAMLVLLTASCLMFVAIWWTQNRFGLLGPTLSPLEVAFWLAWAALIGYSVPLGTAIGYLLLAGAQPATGKVSVPAHLRSPQHLPTGMPFPVELSDPRRLVEPLGPGRAWGRLVPVEGPLAERPLLLTRQVTLLGREADCDIVVADQVTSRHHAELRWDRGRVALVDRGSMNGTRVNGQGVMGQAPLRAGDIVEIGAQRYRFEQFGSQLELTAAPALVSTSEATHKLRGTGRAGPPTLPATPALRLVVASGPLAGATWELNSGVIEVGRDAIRQISLPDRSVSRLHAQIVRQTTGFYLHDMNSQNGTEINGQPLDAPVRLTAGDLVRFGEVELRCEPLAAPTQTPPFVATPRATPPPSPTLAPAPRFDQSTPPGLPRAPSSATPPPLPSAHTRLGPRPDAQDRPHLGPPRLLPTEPPAREA